MIYLDYNATTPVLPEVLEATIPYFTTEWGNPSSTDKFGRKIKSAIETDSWKILMAPQAIAHFDSCHDLGASITLRATSAKM
jgi:cysteine sulfinate desulfinase/cysteine desulfurase-like protein